MRLLSGLVPPGSALLVVGGEGLDCRGREGRIHGDPKRRGSTGGRRPGLRSEVGWRDLAEAAFAIQRGIPWVATNTDWTLPQERGTAPGNGTLVSAVHTAVGILPQLRGKPEVPIFEEAVARFGAEHPLMLGDRLDTDILGANRSGMPSVLVLTGIDGPKQVLAAVPDQRPTYILEDLRGLHSDYPPRRWTAR